MKKKKRARAAGPGALWQDEPERHDFDAANDYLTLILPPDIAATTVKRLKKAPLEQRKAKDILRASRLDLLPTTNTHVRHDLNKVRAGKLLSPVLLLRGDARFGAPLLIADGYHRVCASVHLDEDVEIACRIADIAVRGRA